MSQGSPKSRRGQGSPLLTGSHGSPRRQMASALIEPTASVADHGSIASVIVPDYYNEYTNTGYVHDLGNIVNMVNML